MTGSTRVNRTGTLQSGHFCVSVTIDNVMTKKLSHDPAHWHDRAEDARRVAAEMFDPISRRKMLEIAEGYDGLARREAERLRVRSKAWSG
jgi:hypothetical protein